MKNNRTTTTYPPPAIIKKEIVKKTIELIEKVHSGKVILKKSQLQDDTLYFRLKKGQGYTVVNVTSGEIYSVNLQKIRLENEPDANTLISLWIQLDEWTE